MVSQLCLICGSTYNCQKFCLGARPRYNLVVDEDIKKPTKQTDKHQVAKKNDLRNDTVIKKKRVMVLVFQSMVVLTRTMKMMTTTTENTR